MTSTLDEHNDVYRLWATDQTANEAYASGNASQLDGVIPLDLADMAVTQVAMAYGYTTHELAATTGDTDTGTVEVRHRATRQRLGICHYEHAGHIPNDWAQAAVATVDGQRDVIVVGTANHHTAELAVQRDMPECAHVDVTFSGYGAPDGYHQRDGLPIFNSTSKDDPGAEPYWTVRTPCVPTTVENDDGDAAVIGTTNKFVAQLIATAECPDNDGPPDLEWDGWWVFIDPGATDCNVRPMQPGDDPTWCTPLWHVHP